MIQGLFYRTGWLEMMPHVVHLNIFFEVLAGALIYLYVRACTEKNFQMKPILWLHFIPALLAILYYFPFLIESGEEKVAYYNRYIQKFVLGVPPWTSLLKSILATVYFVLALRLIAQYKKYLSNEASSIDVTYHRWLLLFSSSSLLPILGMIFWGFFGGSQEVITVILTLIFGFVFSVYAVALIKPQIFHTFPNQIVEIEAKDVQRQKYESSSLQDAKKEKFIKKLLTYMETEKPYKEADLTLSTLAEQVNIPAHYLSQVINEKMNNSFLDFVNSYRVKAAKKMLKDVDYENYTIIALAYEAGFNSKTAFYSAFKKFTNTTPSAFRKSADRAIKV